MTRSLGEEWVLAVLVELCERYRAPTTSLILWQLAGGRGVSDRYRSAVVETLERLRGGGRLSCVMHLGCLRWRVSDPAHGRS